MITGMPACGKSVLLKLFDGHPNVYSAHTHDKILSALYGFDDNKVKYLSKKLYGDTSAYISNKSFNQEICYKSKDLELKLSTFFIRYLLNTYTGYYISEQWSHLGVIPDESSSKGYKTENFNFNFSDYEKNWKDNLNKSKEKISPEDFFDCFCNAYFDSWIDYPKAIAGNSHYVFQAPNDPVSASRFVLDESFNIKIIFVYRSVEGQIISKCLRMYRRNSNTIKNLKLEKYILNSISKNIIKRYRNIITEMNELKNRYVNKIYILNIDEFMNDHIKGMLNIADFLDISKNEILFSPTIARHPVSKKYVKKMNDDLVEIKRPVKQLLMLKTRGYKYFKENKEKIDWRIIFPLMKISILKAKKIPIMGKIMIYIYQSIKKI